MDSQTQIFLRKPLSEILSLYENIDVHLVTDQNIFKIYEKELTSLKCGLFIISPGEENKNYRTINNLISYLIKKGADRKSLLIGFGGGIVTDITGFAASIFMRGIRFGFIPTTLLAQTDAAFGGKNGINYNSFKNMIGVFNQPDFININFNYLKTLSDNEFLNGMAEVIKYSLIYDKELFSYLQTHFKVIIERDSVYLEKIILRCVDIKNEIVKEDETEQGLRRILNFGHTIGHALEISEKIKHGFAVSIGMAFSAKLSKKLNLIPSKDYDTIISLLKRYKLPTDLPINQRFIENIDKDKKKNKSTLDFILLDKIGKSLIKKFKTKELKKNLYELY